MTKAATAAELAVRAARRETQRAIAWRSLPYLAITVALLFAYCGGVSHGKAAQLATLHDSIAAALKKQTVVAVAKARVDSGVAGVAAANAVAARVTHAKAAARITVLTDSTVSIDGGPPAKEIPASIAIPEIRTAHAALGADSLSYRAVVAQLGDQVTLTHLEGARADNAEARDRDHHAPRLGIKTGFALGISVAALLVHLLR